MTLRKSSLGLSFQTYNMGAMLVPVTRCYEDFTKCWFCTTSP